jgi:3-oxoacyl-[acyl-carrier protein] reductase
MDTFLAGKHAVVTGGTRGIGRAIAESLLEAGASVAICGRSADAVRSTTSALQAKPGADFFGEPADVSSWDQVERFFRSVESRFGKLDILVNNAGVGVFRSMLEMSREDWHKTLDTNLTGVFYCCRHAVPLLKKSNNGYIIQISSLAGVNAFAGGSAYNASKFGLNGFSEAIMQDLRYENIRVSYIMPGSVDTEFGASGTGAEWKIAPADIAEVVVDLLRTPARTLASRIEMRPSKPKK